jgi:RsiW-degrading membrane proteinase PrsW (M82 family)
LTPRPEDERERRPEFRPVWGAAAAEAALLLALTAVVLLANRVLDLPTSPDQNRTFAIAFGLLPLVLWLVLSWRGEFRADKPRPALFAVLLLSALGANAVGVPLAERFFTVDEWLSNASGGQRILGYTLSIGITQEFIKFAAQRYAGWPGVIRVRTDGVAYALAAGIGYATVLNLNYALNETPLPAAAVLRITEFTLSQVAVSTIMGFFMSEMKLGRLPAIAMPLGLAVAALVNALSITVRAGLVVSGISPESSASNPVQGLGMSIFLVATLFLGIRFLINNADERELLRLREDRR